MPGALLGQVLVGHPGYALSVTCAYPQTGPPRTSCSPAAPRGPARRARRIDLHDGWTVTSFGPAADTSVFDNGDALALLIGGILLERAARPARGRPWRRSLADAGATGDGGAAAARTMPIAGRQDDALPDRYLYEPVTGLPNRELTLDRAERMVARAGRDSGMLAGALFVDIDQLKEVNEKLGLSRREPAA